MPPPPPAAAAHATSCGAQDAGPGRAPDGVTATGRADTGVTRRTGGAENRAAKSARWPDDAKSASGARTVSRLSSVRKIRRCVYA